MLFSGQDALPGLVANAADYSLGVLVLLGLFKALAYGLSLSAFRGGPVFPSMFIGAVLGIALSGLPGMELAPAIGMGIGAMCCAMLRLPLTSVLLATLLMGTDGLTVTPQVVVAVVVSFVVTAVLPTPGARRLGPGAGREPPGQRAPARARRSRGSTEPDRAGRGASRMSVRPERLNATIAWLFMAGSACFVLGSVPAYLNAIGGWADGVTYVVGSVFFTSASYGQLVQAQTPATTAVDEVTQHRARPRASVGLAAARPQLAGRGRPVPGHGVLQHQHHRRPDPQRDGRRVRPLRVAPGPLRVGALPRVERAAPCSRSRTGSSAVQPQSFPWRIAWLNMLGSVLFMASAIASYVVPSTDALLSARLAVAGTFWGAAVLPRRRGPDAARPGDVPVDVRRGRDTPTDSDTYRDPLTQGEDAWPSRPRSTPSQRSTATAS